MATTPRQELINEIGGDLLTYLKAGKLEISPLIKTINPNIKDFDRLIKIHFILTDAVKKFIFDLPNSIRNFKVSTTGQQVISNAEIRGEINWEETIKYRLSTNIFDDTVFVCKEEKREFETKENLVLMEFLNILYNIFFYEFNIEDWNSYEWFRDGKIMAKIIKDIYLKNIYISKIKSKKGKITDRTIESVINNRSLLYSKAAKLLKAYRKINRLDLDEKDLIEIFSETLIHPKQTSTIFELYWIVKIIKLNATDETLHIIDKGNNLICSWHDKRYIYEIYHNVKGANNIVFEVPKEPIKETDYKQSDFVQRLVHIKELSKLMTEIVTGDSKNDNLYSGRPDILVYIIEKETKDIVKLLIGEAKYTDEVETLKQGIEEIQQYLHLGRITLNSGETVYLDKTEIEIEGIVLVDGLILHNDRSENVRFISKIQFNESDLIFNKEQIHTLTN